MSELSDAAIGALRSVLGAENAAVWVHGLASAYVTDKQVKTAVDDAFDEHRGHRDTAERVLRGAGSNPPAAQPAYSLPQGSPTSCSPSRSPAPRWRRRRRWVRRCRC